MKKIFENKTAVVTGGASGIGLAICRIFGMSGASIAIIDFDKKAIDKSVKELIAEGIICTGYFCDISDEKKCDQTIKKIITEFNGIDFLFNNAGITQRSPFLKTEMSVYRKIMDIDFFSTIQCAKSSIESLIQRKGMIIVTSSIAGFAPIIGRSGYSAAKHALHGFYGVLRSELKEKGVGILLVCPGFTNTNLQTRALDGDGSVTNHPQSTTGKVSAPEQVAREILNAVIKRKKLLILSTVGKASYFLTRFVPGLFDYIQNKQLRSELER
jgi:NAD(P)-dependent dehydrogenase (short-subunit alcohol dehydrogenase family)